MGRNWVKDNWEEIFVVKVNGHLQCRCGDYKFSKTKIGTLRMLIVAPSTIFYKKKIGTALNPTEFSLLWKLVYRSVHVLAHQDCRRNCVFIHHLVQFNLFGAVATSIHTYQPTNQPTDDNEHKINYLPELLIKYEVENYTTAFDCVFSMHSMAIGMLTATRWARNTQKFVCFCFCSSPSYLCSQTKDIRNVRFIFASCWRRVRGGNRTGYHSYCDGVFVTTRQSASPTINCFISMIKRISFRLFVRFFSFSFAAPFSNCK